MDDSQVLWTRKEVFTVKNCINNKYMYYAKSTDDVLYSDDSIRDILGYASCGITYGVLRQMLEQRHDLSHDLGAEVISAMIQTGLLHTMEEESRSGECQQHARERSGYPIPNAAYIHLTYRCNKDCTYCYNRAVRKDLTSGQDMSAEILRNILSQLGAYGIRRIVITGGEPFLNTSAMDALREWKGLGNSVGVITNGDLIARNCANPYLDIFDQVTISIDSHIESVADQLRGEGTYKRIHEAIQVLESQGVSWDINSVLTSLNTREFLETETYYKGLGAQDIRPVVVGMLETEYRYLLPEICDIEAYYIEKYDTMRQLLACGKPQKRPNIWFGCGAGIREFAIAPDGTVFPCKLLMSREWECGLINGRRNFKDIWEQSDLLRSIREYLSDDEKCENCIISRHCRGGCLAHSDSRPFDYHDGNSDYYCRINHISVSHRMEINCFIKDLKRCASRGETVGDL